MSKSANRAEELEKNMQRLINKFKYLEYGEVFVNLFDENKHGLGGLEFIFNDALRSSSFSNWSLGALLTARSILQRLIDANSPAKDKFEIIRVKIQTVIDK